MENTYSQFCPIARASHVLCQRWTILILRDMHCGMHRFNELRMGVPKMSPSLLSQRLKDLEHFGILEKRPLPNGDGQGYFLTDAGKETKPLVDMFGIWGTRWLRDRLVKDELEEKLLVYAISIGVNRRYFRRNRVVVQLRFNDRPRIDWPVWWLVVEKDKDVDLCVDDPGFEVDLVVESTLRPLIEVWVGQRDATAEIEAGRVKVYGDEALASTFPSWFKGSPFNVVPPPDKPLDSLKLVADLQE